MRRFKPSVIAAAALAMALAALAPASGGATVGRASGGAGHIGSRNNWNLSWACNPDPVRIRDVFTCAADAPKYNTGETARVNRWAWDFGDGTSGLGQSVTHVYKFAAQFTVTLTASDDQGGYGTGTQTMVVVDPSAEAPSLSTSGVAVPTATPAPQPPGAPSNLSAAVLSDTSIRIDWSDGAGSEDGVRVYADSRFVAALAAHATTYTLTGLTPGTYHCAIVQAYNAGGNSGWSNWGCATTSQPAAPAAPPSSATTPPAAPSNLQATVLDATRVRLDWSDNSDNETGFQINDAATGQVVTQTGPNATSYTLVGLSPGGTYCSTVSALNQVGTSDPSNQACATTPLQ